MSRTTQRWQVPLVARYPKPKAVQFVSAEEFLTLAMQSHLAAVRDSLPPLGERWAHPECDGAWSGPEDFFDGLLRHLGERLRQRALARGDLVEVPWDDDGDGVSVAVGHGDVSPAPVTLVHLQESAHSKRDRSPDAAPANPLLLGLRGQELPERGTLNHTQTHEGHVSHG